jgi:tRNA(Ile)-lysidine synthetase-like protein
MRRVQANLPQLLKRAPDGRFDRPVELCVLFSGGKDSTALLHALWQISLSTLFRPQFPVRVTALHFDHHTRGGQSTEDALWVSHFCLTRGIPLHICTRFEPWSSSSSFQAQASAWRRRICADLALRQDRSTPPGPSQVYLTAHHLADVAETVLMNIIRGCGNAGLSGISPASTDPLMLRPLLDEPQEALMTYLSDRGLDWCEDSSNQGLDYTRNQVRHEIMPRLKRLNPAVQVHLKNLGIHTSVRGKAILAASDRTQRHPKILPLALASSTHALYDWIADNWPEYLRLLTARQLANLSDHAQGQQQISVKDDTLPCTFVQLAKGWTARICPRGVELVPVSQTGESAKMMGQMPPDWFAVTDRSSYDLNFGP